MTQEMTQEKRRENWQHFTRAACDFLEHPETDVKVFEPVIRMLEEIAPDEDSIDHFRRVLPLIADTLPIADTSTDVPVEPKKPTRNPNRRPYDSEDRFEDYCLDLGQAMGDILKDDQTPETIRSAFKSLVAHFDTIAERQDPRGREAAYTWHFFPEVLIIASFEDDADHQADSQEVPVA